MHRFIGTWSLETWTSGNAEPFGPNPQGKLVYTAEGTMISAFMRRGRTPIGRSIEDLAAWRWASKDSEEMDLHHDVEIAMFPDWIGTRFSRVYEFNRDQLSLSFGSDVLLWRRKESGSDPDSGGGDGDALR